MYKAIMGKLRDTGLKASASFGLGGSRTAYYAADGETETMVNWHPLSKSADSEILPKRKKITARTKDLARNNGWVAGGINKEVDAIIGSNFRPRAKPNWQVLGLSEDWAGEYKQRVDALWRADAEDPRHFQDLTRTQSISQLFGMAYRNYVLEGDAIAVLGWRSNRPTHTVIRVVDPDLLSNPNDAEDTKTTRGGVEIDGDGVSYCISLSSRFCQ